MFERNNPAESVLEVMQFLKGEHHENYLYRGQVKDYGKMLPSIFRTVPLIPRDGFLLFERKFDASRIEVLKATLVYSFIERFGNLVGNYLAQQYLANSACIDVTEDINVAAFFAKMLYPTYSNMIESSNEIGVIYRFNKTEFSLNFRPSGIKKNCFSSNNPAAYKTRELAEAFTTTDYSFTSDYNDTGKYYFIHDNITTYSDMKPYLGDYDKELMKFHDDYEEEFTSFARPKAQMGGMIQPKLLCKYDESMKVDPNMGNIFGLEDIYGKYGMEAFYFKHVKRDLRLTRNDIWPHLSKDVMLMILSHMVFTSKAKGKIESEINIKDLIDYGFDENIYQNF